MEAHHDITAPLGIFSPGRGSRALIMRMVGEYPAQPVAVFSDLYNAPYGGRPADEVVEFAARGCSWLVLQGARRIIIACNTTSLVSGELACRFADEGVEIIDVLSATERGLARLPRGISLGVVGTPATIESGHYQSLLARHGHTSTRFCSSAILARLIDAAGDRLTPEIEGVIVELLRGLSHHEWLPTHLLLACTHYELVKESFERHAAQQWGRSVTCVGQTPFLIDELVARDLLAAPGPAARTRSCKGVLGTNDPNDNEMREYAAALGLDFRVIEP